MRLGIMASPFCFSGGQPRPRTTNLMRYRNRLSAYQRSFALAVYLICLLQSLPCCSLLFPHFVWAHFHADAAYVIRNAGKHESGDSFPFTLNSHLFNFIVVITRLPPAGSSTSHVTCAYWTNPFSSGIKRISSEGFDLCHATIWIAFLS